jgi:nitroreductase
METEEAIKTRRSVKHYDPAHQMTDDEINKLMSLAILPPRLFDLQVSSGCGCSGMVMNGVRSTWKKGIDVTSP